MTEARQRRQHEVWHALGEQDPDWAVLSEHRRRGGGWSDDLPEFYRTGQRDVDNCLELLPTPFTGTALDFGAGTGRLSFALASHATSVTAVDVSRPMLDLLGARAAERSITNIRTLPADELPTSPVHDLAISLLVFQHLPDPATVWATLGNIVRSLRPGGQLVVEIPDRALLLRARVQIRARIYRLARSVGVPAERLTHLGLSGVSMLTVPSADVVDALGRLGVETVRTVASCAGAYRQIRYVGYVR